MFFDAIAVPLALLAVALPFLFAVTDSPIANFWPLIASWVCGAVLLLLAAGWARTGVAQRRGPAGWGWLLAGGLGLAALVASVIGLVQYLAGDVGLGPWIHASVPGQAVGNLRQRNQQATLLSLGAWAWLWWTLHARPQGNADLAGAASPGRAPSSGVWGVLTAVALMWIAVGGAATASRTVVVQWLLVLVLLVVWRGAGRGEALRLGIAGFAVFLVAAWVLPEALWRFQGVRADALFHRFTDGSHSCTSRRVLWSNVLTLIAQKPWLGWGWGELDYAHYITLFPGERFCVLLDNAHNLPLHLAVELGLPAAVALCGVVVAGCLWARPWRETEPVRQLAWGVLALIGLHSMLEYPLWYGPFQVVALLSVAILVWPRRDEAWDGRAWPAGAAALVAALAVLGACGLAAWDYHRVSQLYKPGAQRAAAYREDTQAKVSHSLLFSGPLDFARLTTTGLTRDNAARMNALAQELLHYSPEPRVIEVLVESAVMLGKDDEAAFHMKRYRAAYPDDYARWMGAGGTRASQAR
ncbi:polymerase [Acidovorax sp. JMULE5]|uniref:Wzy polymerase domain-containing protein n=1 Tax=Acidovorax sp. JMULE5 TaxID=2518343 RepID=UPI0015A136FA|nr:Wzy polymerase domain-containing protein [Acidovorax sp. JMULE5]QLA81295.1 polymerase [Acidovorax sp. JMULE5]